MPFPPYPAFPKDVRLATYADIPRLAEMQVIGAADDSIRKGVQAYPQYLQSKQSALAVAVERYHSAIRHPECIVVVAEAPQSVSEVSPPSSASDAVNEDAQGKPQRVVIASIIYRIPHGSPRYGQFNKLPDDDSAKFAPPNGAASIDSLTSAFKMAERRWLGGALVGRHFAAHPLYETRDFGVAMDRWTLTICDYDNVQMGLLTKRLTSNMKNLGFAEIGILHVFPKGEPPTRWVALLRHPPGRQGQVLEDIETIEYSEE